MAIRIKIEGQDVDENSSLSPPRKLAVTSNLNHFRRLLAMRCRKHGREPEILVSYNRFNDQRSDNEGITTYPDMCCRAFTLEVSEQSMRSR